MSKAFTITPILDKLMRGDEQTPVGLYHLHLLTAAQLTRLHLKKRVRAICTSGIY